MGIARAPILHRLGGRGSLRNRLRRMQPIEMRYEVNSAAIRRLTIELKAAVDPMLIMPIKTAMERETRMELRGISTPTLTT
jgi:hypothetical protein